MGRRSALPLLSSEVLIHPSMLPGIVLQDSRPRPSIMDSEKRVKNAMRSFQSATEQLETVDRADPLDQIAAFTPYNFQPASTSTPAKPRCRPWSQPDYIVRLW